MDDTAQLLERQYTETGPSLLSYFRRRTSAAAVDDLLQETFLRAWQHRERLQRAASPRAYLFGIARHVCADAQRAVRHLESLPDDLVAADPATDTDDLLRLREAIAALPETHREPLRLKLQHELSYVEIAEILEVPVGTIRSRLHYAVQQLQDELVASGNLETGAGESPS